MITADDQEFAVSCMLAALEPLADRDWSATTGQLEWDCWHTAEHIGDCPLSYAAQLVAQPADGYARFLVSAEPDASPAEVLEFAKICGGILLSTVRTSPPNVRAHHPTGMTDAEGFAGLGCVEALLHGQDIAAGLGVDLNPPRGLCALVLAERFPQTSADVSDLDPWTAPQWATGRADTPNHPRRKQW